METPTGRSTGADSVRNPLSLRAPARRSMDAVANETSEKHPGVMWPTARASVLKRDSAASSLMFFALKEHAVAYIPSTCEPSRFSLSCKAARCRKRFGFKVR